MSSNTCTSDWVATDLTDLELTALESQELPCMYLDHQDVEGRTVTVSRTLTVFQSY